MTHTPGPYKVAFDETIQKWVVFITKDREPEYTDGEKFIGADYFTICICDSEPNARLIAAAPELLEVLEKMLESPQSALDNLGNAMRVIAKARFG